MNTKHALALPLALGSKGKFETYNPGIVFDATGSGLFSLYNIPINGSLEEIEKSGRYDEALTKARYIITAVNSHEELVNAMKNLIDVADLSGRGEQAREEAKAILKKLEAQ